jgi:hypothetical protein
MFNCQSANAGVDNSDRAKVNALLIRTPPMFVNTGLTKLQ